MLIHNIKVNESIPKHTETVAAAESTAQIYEIQQ